MLSDDVCPTEFTLHSRDQTRQCPIDAPYRDESISRAMSVEDFRARRGRGASGGLGASIMTWFPFVDPAVGLDGKYGPGRGRGQWGGVDATRRVTASVDPAGAGARQFRRPVATAVGRWRGGRGCSDRRGMLGLCAAVLGQQCGQQLRSVSRSGTGNVSTVSSRQSQLLDRLSALVPPPRRHRHRYHGVLAPHAPSVPQGPPAKGPPRAGPVHEAEADRVSPSPIARGPPPVEKDFHPDAGTHLSEPLPEYELDQRVNW
jgi:hypothetical protein